MRQVRNLEDAQVAIRELYSLFDKLNSKDIDMSKRRVVNASPSKEPYDYVIRKEFIDLKKQVQVTKSVDTVTPGGIVNFSIIFNSYGRVVSAPLASPPYIFQRACIPLRVSLSSSAPSSSAGTFFNFLYKGLYLLNTPIELPTTATALEIFESTDLNPSIVEFSLDEVIVLSVLSSGSPSKVTLQIFVEQV